MCRGSKRLPFVCISIVNKCLHVGGWKDFSLTASSISDCRLDQQLNLCVPKLLSAGETDCLSASAGSAPLSAMTLHI